MFRRAAGLGEREAWGNLGWLLAGEGRVDEAVAAYRRAVGEREVRALVGLVDVLADAGRWEEAIRAYEQALEAGDEDARERYESLLRES